MQKVTDNIYVLVIMAMAGTGILVATFILFMLRNQLRLTAQKEKLKMAEIAHQKELLRSVIESQEAERTRIGRDLHDDVGTALSGLSMMLEQIAREPYNEASFNQFRSDSRRIIDKVLVDVRGIAHNLSPEILTLNTLSEAIGELCYVVNNTGKLKVFMVNEVRDILDGFELTVALALYRILEELFNNTVRHAGASVINISIVKEGELLVLDYRDDGRGMPAVPALQKGRGLHNIESRLDIMQGTHVVYSRPGTGYHLQVKIPVSETAK